MYMHMCNHAYANACLMHMCSYAHTSLTCTQLVIQCTEACVPPARTHMSTLTYSHAHTSGRCATYRYANRQIALVPSLIKERKRERKDINEGNINNPMAGSEKNLVTIIPGESRCRIDIKTVYQKSCWKDL